MKNIFLVIILTLLLVPSNALAYVESYEHHVLFSYGLSELGLSRKMIYEAGFETLALSGEDLSDIEIDGKKKNPNEQNEILFIPGGAERGSFDFWKVEGANKGEDFFIFGYTIETGGDTWFEKNSFIMAIVYSTIIIALLIHFAFLLMKHTKNLR